MIAAKPVDGESEKQVALVLLQEVDGADDGREDAAALDVGHEQPWRLDGRRQPQVDEIDVAEIQLADAARPFDDDRVEAARQAS